MNELFKFGKPMKVIYAGELFVSKDDEFIATLLGSCISICFHDSVNKISGMNHFMLPGKINIDEAKKASSSKYGVTAIKSLLASMYKFGAQKENITAKIFGGGNVLDVFREKGPVATGNISVARIMVEHEDISIIEEDIAGEFTRKIIMDVHSGKVFLKKTTRHQSFDEI